MQARIAELLRPAVRKTRTTVDSLAAQFDAVFDGATSDKQWGAAGSAAALKAKLLGFMREQIEVGPAGAFSQCNNVDDVASKTLDQLDLADALANLDMLRDALLRAASDRAIPIT
jgi:hypothetical protein